MHNVAEQLNEAFLLGMWRIDPQASSVVPVFRKVRIQRQNHQLRFEASIQGKGVCAGFITTKWNPVDDSLFRHEVRFHFDDGTLATVHYQLDDTLLAHGMMVFRSLDLTQSVIVFERPLPVEHALVGSWHAATKAIHRGDYALDSFVLMMDGTYQQYLAGGVVRKGDWGFFRTADGTVLVGVLKLTPEDRIFTVEHFELRFSMRGPQSVLELMSEENGTWLRLTRFSSSLHPGLYGHWRRQVSDGEDVSLALPVAWHLQRYGHLRVLIQDEKTWTTGSWRFVQRDLNVFSVPTITGKLSIELYRSKHPTKRGDYHCELNLRNGLLIVASTQHAAAGTYHRLSRE